MYTDEEIEREIEDSIDRLADEGAFDPDVYVENPKEDLDSAIKEFGFFNVTCKYGCGTYPVEEAEVLSMDVSQGTATFRCRLCNDIQTAELLIID